MANKDEVIAKMQSLEGEIEEAVSSMPEPAWAKGVYEGGWNARQLLAHMASTSGTAGFILGMARMSSAPNLGAGYDENAFNAQQVASREGKSIADIVGEIKTNFERGIDAVRNAPDDLLTKHWRAPWDVEGEVGEVIVMSLEGHLGMHLADLRSAAV
jgi:mycothiol maleylpyruvate isomerase-like protein